MKQLTTITLTQFRNYTFQQYQFDSKVIAFTGNNGSGKTNLLDAIYYMCFTKSYFQSKEINNIQNGKEGFRIDATVLIDNEINKMSCVFKDNKKTFNHNSIAYEKLSEHIGKYGAVMIAPDDIKIITDTSEFRRKFFDGMISQVNSDYLDHLLLYQKFHQQKNSYLKLNDNIDWLLIDYYNQQLRIHGNYIIEIRKNFTESYKKFAINNYNIIANNKEIIDIIYTPNVRIDNWEQQQKNVINNEIIAKRNTLGPHIDDWIFTINDNPFKTQSSQGQKKSLLIGLKLAQLHILIDKNLEPFLLLDDIFEKLDHKRLHHFFNLLKELPISQIFISHTEEDDVLHLAKPIFNNIQIINL